MYTRHPTSSFIALFCIRIQIRALISTVRVVLFVVCVCETTLFRPQSLAHSEQKHSQLYRGADKSLARPTPRCIFLMVRIFHLMLVLIYIYIYIYIHIYIYTGCPGRNVPDSGRMFLKLKYTDITQNTYIQS